MEGHYFKLCVFRRKGTAVYMDTWFITSYSCWSELLIWGSITWMSSNISLFITTSVVLLKERKTQHHLTRPATFNSSSPTVDLPHERQSRSQNPALLNPEFSLRNPESRLTIEIRNPSSTGKESEIQHLESGIFSVESRIQDSLRLPLLERIDEAEI